VRSALARTDALLTTWDSPRFDASLPSVAPRLRLVAHCGGEVKGRFARPLFERLTITNAAGPMAPYVAELAVTFLLHAARNVDARALDLLPDGATVINVARGGLVDLDALTREVRRGRLRCALDVTDPLEPLPPRHPLRRLRGAVLTPHVGSAQADVRRQMADV